MPSFRRRPVRLPLAFLERAHDQLFLRLRHGQIRLRQQPLPDSPRRGRRAAGPRGKSRSRDAFAAGQHHGVFHGGAQFAHVARPGIIHQRFERFRR